jgi:DNA replication and repair protein RecF
MTYSKQMAGPALFVHNTRKDFLGDFHDVFVKKYATISHEQEEVDIEYKSQLFRQPFIEGTEEAMEKDRILGRTTFGIHKDDLVFRMNNKPVKNFASQGQTKSFVLSLKLSQYEILSKNHKSKPILMLDDLFAKLDHKRVQHLIELLEHENVDQVFISDTDEHRLVNILNKMNVEYNKVVINSGKIQNDHEASEEE